MFERVNSVFIEVIGYEIEDFVAVIELGILFPCNVLLHKIPNLGSLLPVDRLRPSCSGLPVIVIDCLVVIVYDDVEILPLQETGVLLAEVVCDYAVPDLLARPAARAIVKNSCGLGD